MFPLHDRTRRFICRTLFLLCGVLPTVVILGWCLSVRSAGQLAAVRAQLETTLGLKVQVAKVSYPRPGCTLLSGVELADPETGQAVATMRLLEINSDGPGETVFASQPEIDAAAARHLASVIDGWLRRPVNSHDQHSSDLRFAAGELTLRWTGGAQTFVDCSAQLESSSAGNAAEATFRLANSDAAQPIQLRWHRSSQSGQPASSLKLQADSAPLPFPLIAVLLERENHWGPHSTLQGSLNALETPDGWQAELAGRVENIDLHWAVTEQFPHQLSGMAELTINHAVLHAGRLEEARGTIHAGPGSVSSSLLAAAAAMLGLARGRMENSPNGSPGDMTSGNVLSVNAIPYEELAADFRLDAGGLSIRGRCSGKQNGIVMRGPGDNVLLADSNAGSVPVVALVKMLVPDSRVQVPATRQTDWLLNLLPVPDVVPGDPQAVPQARLRGGKDLH
jgi:hypothetical protein